MPSNARTVFLDAPALPRPDPHPAPAPRTLEEIVVPVTGDGAYVALAFAGAGPGLIVHVSDRVSEREMGRLHARGLSRPADTVRVRARDAKGALWAMEQSLACPAVALVVGELYGAPRALDFTASRRLALAAERHGTRCVLVRIGGAGASAARRRWEIASRPSHSPPHDDRAPGLPRWHVALRRARNEPPGAWEADGSELQALLGGRRADRDAAAAPIGEPHAIPVPADGVLVALDAVRARRTIRSPMQRAVGE